MRRCDGMVDIADLKSEVPNGRPGRKPVVPQRFLFELLYSGGPVTSWVTSKSQKTFLQVYIRRYGGIGRHRGLKIHWKVTFVPVRVRLAAPKTAVLETKWLFFCLDNKEVTVLSLCFFLGSRQNLKNCICRTDLGSKFLMHINICRGGNRTVT